MKVSGTFSVVKKTSSIRRTSTVTAAHLFSLVHVLLWSSVRPPGVKQETLVPHRATTPTMM